VIGQVVVSGLSANGQRDELRQIEDDLEAMARSWRGLQSQLRESRRHLGPKRWSELERRATGFSEHFERLRRQSYHLSRRSANAATQLSLLGNLLEDRLQDIRLMPVVPFLESFAAAAREAARTKARRVRLSCSQLEIEADRLVLERIREALAHLVRNAVAHGIEPPEVRAARGKPPVGRITLQATIRGESLVVQVTDDGAGIDREAVAARALAAGITIDRGATDSGLLAQLRHPGLSTTERPDLISGRGLGMDVAALAVEELGGELSLTTTPGEGTTFTLRVPLTVGTTSGLVLAIDRFEVGIPLDAVIRVVRLRPTDLRQIRGAPVIDQDEEFISVVSLCALLGVPEAPWVESARPALVASVGERKVAVLVDDVIGEMPMVLEPLGPQFAQVDHLAGGAIRADGSVLPVLDLRRLLRRSSRPVAPARDPAAASTPAPATERQLVVLVVDDSITMRSLERNILQTAGYRVILASDGQEALHALRTESQIDGVVTDIEMPGMDGLELCRRVRSSRWSHLPVIMVTSLGSDPERAAGVSAGADAYLAKGDFRQEVFLSTIRRLVG